MSITTTHRKNEAYGSVVVSVRSVTQLLVRVLIC